MERAMETLLADIVEVKAQAEDWRMTALGRGRDEAPGNIEYATRMLAGDESAPGADAGATRQDARGQRRTAA